MFELKLFTVKDLQNWLYGANPTKGLSNRIISQQRAWAIIHNPYVFESDTVLASIFVDGEIAAYSAAFPEKSVTFGDKRFWWITTLFCEKKFEGRGLGIVAIGAFIELYGKDFCFDADGAPETIGIFSYFGHQTEYFSQYFLRQKRFANTIKGKFLSFINRKERLKRISFFESKISSLKYSLKYTSFVSGNSYEFILNKSDGDVWLRSQSTLNWILGYPFMQPGLVQERVTLDLFFTSNIKSYLLYAVEVYADHGLVGLYIVRDSVWNFAIPYLYFDEVFKNEVYSSVAENYLRSGNKCFTTMSKELSDFMMDNGIFDVVDKEEKSFSYPVSFKARNKKMQLGDGDMFVF